MVIVRARVSASRKPHATRSVHEGPAHLHGQRRRDQAEGSGGLGGGLGGGWLEPSEVQWLFSGGAFRGLASIGECRASFGRVPSPDQSRQG